ncbi:unnamed protein product [Cyclocybe aegerita]|uniref:DUF6535 domain-containing protein n=1 Tax=Cyclocybe aegerita TaxID=1973307 RepID=A0A8S0VXD6_CYCAE|nr:unnamed protein product [Cyclocybe aegerita]
MNDSPAPAVNAANTNADQRPSWMESSPWVSGDPLRYPLPGAEDPWGKCHQLVKDYDEARCGRWKDELQNLLIFAGLASAVVTAFAVETQKLLQEDAQDTAALLLARISAQIGLNASSSTSFTPLQTTLTPFSATRQAIRINALVFLSLALSLATVLFGTLTLQWIREFQRKDSLSHTDSLVIRQIRFDGLVQWKVPQIVSFLPVILQIALLCFLAGLVDFLAPVNRSVAIIVGVVVGLTFILTMAATVLPAFQSLYYVVLFPRRDIAQCPYKSPLSGMFFRLFFAPFSFFLGVPVTRLDHQLTLQSLARFVNAKNWADYNHIWKTYTHTTADSPLVWAARTFSQNLEALYAIYHCFQGVDLQTKWKAYWRIEALPQDPPLFIGNLEPREQELLRDLATEGIVRLLTTDQDSDSFTLHHLELYNRITASASDFSQVMTNPDSRQWLKNCKPKPPNTSWSPVNPARYYFSA